METQKITSAFSGLTRILMRLLYKPATPSGFKLISGYCISASVKGPKPQQNKKMKVRIADAIFIQCLEVVTNVWQFGIQVNLGGKYCIAVWLTVSTQDLFITVTDLWISKDKVTVCKSWKLIRNGDINSCILIDTKWKFVVTHMSWK